MSVANNDNNKRILALDGLRGVAVLIVLFHHLVLDSGLDRSVLVDRQIWKLAGLSWVGVDLFFVLSGFLITGILLKAKGTDHYFRNFYGRRVLRIFPLYYAYLLFAILLFPLWLPAETGNELIETQTWYWLYLSNIHVAMTGWPNAEGVGHFWSLAVEEQFYLLWPLVVWLLPRRALLYVAASCFFGAIFFRVITPSTLDIYVLLPTRMDTLAAGAFVAILLQQNQGSKMLGNWPLLVFSACGSILFAMLIIPNGNINYHDPVFSIIGYSLIAATFAALIGMLVNSDPRGPLNRLASNQMLVFMGKYSYGLYVLHVPIIWLMETQGLHADLVPRAFGSSLPGVIVFFSTGLFLSIACAMVSFHLWESRFLALKRYFPYQSTRGSLTGSRQPQAKTVIQPYIGFRKNVTTTHP